MEVFEVHITGNDLIHEVAAKRDEKTIAVDLLRPDKTVIRTEHMTSLIFKLPQTNSYEKCKEIVDEIVKDYTQSGVEIFRVKIESPFYDYYINKSIYVESHFETDDTRYPISRNQKKTTFLATDREYNMNKYEEFVERHVGNDLELCLYDTFPTEDLDWLGLFNGYARSSV